MKPLITISSDLHLNFYDGFIDIDPLANLFTGGKFLILAGDLCEEDSSEKLEHFIRSVYDRFDYILAVSGNHDWWRAPYLPEQRSCLVEISELYNKFHLLNRNIIELDGYKFAGCTAWYELDQVCAMNDLRRIHDAVNFTKTESHLDKTFLKGLIGKGIDVLITHVPLIEEGMNPILAANNPYLNKYYHHNCGELVDRIAPSIAVSGHTHHEINLIKGITRYVSSPVGYPSDIKYDFKPLVMGGMTD